MPSDWDNMHIENWGTMPGLTELVLRGPGYYNSILRSPVIAWIAACGTLKKLDLSNWGRYEDLSVLGRLPLEELVSGQGEQRSASFLHPHLPSRWTYYYTVLALRLPAGRFSPFFWGSIRALSAAGVDLI